MGRGGGSKKRDGHERTHYWSHGVHGDGAAVYVEPGNPLAVWVRSGETLAAGRHLLSSVVVPCIGGRGFGRERVSKPYYLLVFDLFRK